MGKHFGDLYYIRNIIYYKLSNYEQRAIPNLFRDTIKNAISETKEHAPVILPPAAFFYLLFKSTEKEYERRLRKDVNLYKQYEPKDDEE